VTLRQDYDWVQPSEVVPPSPSTGVFQDQNVPDIVLVKWMETPGGSSLDKPVVIEFKAPGLHLVHNGRNSALITMFRRIG
jgi:hypothetical protein